MPSTLLTIPHQPQLSDGDCLAACAAMVLEHLGISVGYDRLLRLLDVKPYGAPGSRLKNLGDLGVNDPAFEQAPQRVPQADFELAWMGFDYRYAVIWR